MCLAVPAEVIELLEGGGARVEMAGVRKVIAIDLIPDLAVGDWVLIHVGHALARIDAEEARKTLELLAEVFGEGADVFDEADAAVDSPLMAGAKP